MRRAFAVAFAVRVIAIIYGVWHDAVFAVKYTDVDYHVFSDAARLVNEGRSPYDRHTYRYTPLLAWLLSPLVAWHPAAGKLLFAAVDLVVGWLVHRVALSRGYSAPLARRAALAWLFNPVSVNVSTRGSADALVVALTLGLALAAETGAFAAAGTLLGVATHLRLFPALHALPLVLHAARWTLAESVTPASACGACRAAERDDDVSECRACGGALRKPPLCVRSRRLARAMLGKHAVRAGVCAALSFGALFAVCYRAYGGEFVREAYAFHVSRKDHRHNFSPHHLHLYLSTATAPDDGVAAAVAALLPLALQITALGAVGVALRRSFTLACVAQTWLFVALNKVSTAQYFVWYLALLPACVPPSRAAGRRLARPALVWGATCACWLLTGWLVEFAGVPAFRLMHLASIAFLVSNAYFLARVLREAGR